MVNQSESASLDPASTPSRQAASSYGAISLGDSGPTASTPPPHPEGPGEGAPASTQIEVVELTAQNFQSIVELSARVPVLVEATTEEAEASTNLGQSIVQVLRGMPGRFQFCVLEATSNAALVQALQIQGVPTVLALIGGQPVPLFAGAQDIPTLQKVLQEVLQVAAKMGVTGTLDTAVEEPEPPATHRAAWAAQEAEDWAEAIAKWEQAIEENPHDTVAKESLAQARLQHRLSQEDDSTEPSSQADHFAAVGNYHHAFEILLEQIAQTGGEERDGYRSQLVDLFKIAGDDAAVGPARARLASLLF